MARPRYPHPKSHERSFNDSSRSGQGSLEPEPQLHQQIRSSATTQGEPFPLQKQTNRPNLQVCTFIVFKSDSTSSLHLLPRLLGRHFLPILALYIDLGTLVASILSICPILPSIYLWIIQLMKEAKSIIITAFSHVFLTSSSRIYQ